MRGRLGRRLFGAMMTCGLMMAGPALAGGSGMPWEGPLEQVVDYYHATLKTSPEALAYLRGRGVEGESAHGSGSGIA